MMGDGRDARLDARRRRLPHAGRVRAARRLLDGLAGAARQLAARRRAGAGGLRRGGRGDRRLRAGDDGRLRRPVRARPGAAAARRPGGRARHRRRLDARHRPDLRRRRRGGRRGVDWRFNAWGGLEGGLYSPWDRDDRVAAKVLEIEGADRYRRAARARGRLDPRRRRGHGADHRRVPAQPQPQPGARPGADRAGAARLPRGREGRLARARRLRRRDRRPRRQPRLLRPARASSCSPGARTSPTPSTRSPATRWSGWKRRPTPAAAPSRWSSSPPRARCTTTAEEAAGVEAPRGHPAAPGRRPPRRLLRQLLPRQLARGDAAAGRAPRRRGGGDPARLLPRPRGGRRARPRDPARRRQHPLHHAAGACRRGCASL